MDPTTCVTQHGDAAHTLASMHVIDAVKVCLACVVNVQPLVPVSESCCPLHMFCCVSLPPLHECANQLSYNDNHLSIRTQTLTHTHHKRCEPRLPTIFQAVYKVSRKINGVLYRDKRPGRRSSWTFCLFPHFPLQADVTVKVDEPPRASVSVEIRQVRRRLRLKRCETTPETPGLHCRSPSGAPSHCRAAPDKALIRESWQFKSSGRARRLVYCSECDWE